MKALASDLPGACNASAAEKDRQHDGDLPHQRRQAALSAFGRRVSCQPPLRVLLEDAVTLAGDALQVDCGYYGFVTEGKIDVEIRTSLGQRASGEGPPERFAWPLEGNSAAACSLRSAEILAAQDLSAERRFADPKLRELGAAAALIVPLYLNARPFGVIGLCCARPRPWSEDDILFVETIAHMLTAMAARLKSEDRLREEQAARSTILGMVQAIVITLDCEGRITDMNRTCERLTQFALSELRGRHLWDLLVVPEEAELVASVFRGSKAEKIPSEFTTFMRAKDGTIRRVSWSLKTLRRGGVQSILLTGEDRTEHDQAIERLQKMTKLARKALGVYLGPSSPPSAECRSAPRHVYPYAQMIAPCQEGSTPAPDSFFPVQCKDISAAGVAFFLDRLPDFQTFVLALGPPPRVTRVVCRVIRVAAAEVDDKRKYLVGCTFIGRTL